MKVVKFVRILNRCSDILELFGDLDVETALEEIYNTCAKAKSVEEVCIKEELPDYHVVINSEYIKMLASLSRKDLDEKLQSEDILKSKSALLYLASQLGISSSKRQSMDNLRYYISSYFERNRMDEMIKNSRVMPQKDKTD